MRYPALRRLLVDAYFEETERATTAPEAPAPAIAV
jgi:hypothetical protein